jgi:sirohydrochlorin ferrochelatase
VSPILELQTAGIVIVDHGSRRQESNDLLDHFVTIFRERTKFKVVQAAHMELADPSIEQAFGRCIDQKVQSIVVCPFFLLPGRHWQDDLPRLAAAASRKFGDIGYLVTSPLGAHELLVDVMVDRLQFCLSDQSGQPCSNCQGERRCRSAGTNLS